MHGYDETNAGRGDKETMSILSEVKKLLEITKIPIETGAFSGSAPDKYIVLVPLNDEFPVNADNTPQIDLQALRITLFAKGNYGKEKNQIVRLLIAEDFAITDRKYNGHDPSTDYYQYSIDVEKQYEMEEMK